MSDLLRPGATLLAGRERELAALRETLTGVLAGHGSLVLVGGEAGIGKTTLVEAALREARGLGCTILEGRCFDLAETPPYGPFIDLFARFAPQSGDPPLPEAFAVRGTVGSVPGPLALVVQIQDFLSALAARQPVVVLLEDAHWADLASLDLLRVLARGVGALPLCMLVTYRSDELTRRHPLYALLPQLAREVSAVRIALASLDDGAVRALIDTRYGLLEGDAIRLATYIQGRGEGNPLFVGELLRTLEERGALAVSDGAWRVGELGGASIPTLLRQVLDGRIARLDEASQRLLAVAAIIGHEVPFELWAEVVEVVEETLIDLTERAEEAHLLATTSDGAGVRFAHALIREALYEGMPALRRRRVHRRIGEVLSAAPAPDPDAVALHFQRAGDTAALPWLVRAGERAQLAYAWPTAIARYEAALAILEAGDSNLAERGWLRYRVACLNRNYAPEASRDYLDEALAIADTLGDRALAAAARFARAMCISYMNDATSYDELRASCDALEALPLADRERLDLGPDAQGRPTITHARGFLVMVLSAAGHLTEALAMGEGVRDGMPRHAPLAEIARGNYGNRHAGLANAYALLGRPDDARAAFARTRESLKEVGRYAGNHATIELFLLRIPYFADQPEALPPLAEASTADYRKMAFSPYEFLAHLPMLILAGHWAEARKHAEIAHQGIPLQLFRTLGTLTLLRLARVQGEEERAKALVDALFPSGPLPPPGMQIWIVELPLMRECAALALDTNDLAAARTWLAMHDRWLAWNGSVLGRSEGEALWAQYARQVGDLTQARVRAERALTHATEPRQPLALLGAHRLLGELATQDGECTEAQRHLEVALALAKACAAPFERALCLIALAELRSAENAASAARVALDDALTSLTALEARPALARAAALAARLADMAPVPAPREAVPFGLTPREAEVLRLVAQGRGNLDIADQLSLSRRTVEQHLRSVYDKLGVENRTAAARFAVEHGLA